MTNIKKPKSRVLRSPKSGARASKKHPGIVVILSAVAGAIIGSVFMPGLRGVIAGGAVGGTVGAVRDKEKKVARIPVFYSFHFGNDAMRVQQVRNIGSIDGNSPTSPNEWERLKRAGDKAVMNWIDQSMNYKRCVLVLIGSDTANRPWVRYEIEKAWNDGRALLGIYIHNLKCPRNGTCRKGKNPFDEFTFRDGRKLSTVVQCYDPNPVAAYRDIADNLSRWIDHAISNKAN